MPTTKSSTPIKSAASAKIPAESAAHFADGSVRRVQVNFCKNPNCANFGVPASLNKHAHRAKAAPAMGVEYTITGKGGGRVNLACRLCAEVLPIKSNQGIVEEIDRISDFLNPEPQPCCPNEGCTNHTIPVTHGRNYYYSKGKTEIGSQRYACRACGKTFSVAATSTHRQRLAYKNITIFKLLLGKMPLSRICDAMDIAPKTLYERIDFFHDQCMAYAAAQERKLLEGKTYFGMHIAVDRQAYVVNWTQRKDKRNVMLQAIGSAELMSGYVFGMHLNFDASLNSMAVEADAVAAGDYAAQMPFRRYARLWLEQDYDKAVLESTARLAKKLKRGLTLDEDISAAYSEAEARPDVESPELVTVEEQFPLHGMQVRSEYTMYAHFYYLRQLFRGVDKVRFFMDQESGIRAACLAAFESEIRERRCDAFYVRLAKELTVDEKRKIVLNSRKLFDAMQKANPTLSRSQVEVLMMKAEMARAATHGKWSDKWLRHPFPNNAEPEKAVCYLTDMGDYDEDHLAKLYLRASLHPIDRFFMQVRRRLSMLERPIGTASKVGRTWYGYSPYNPAIIEKLLDIFRVYYNYCLAGKEDKETPAMRLGLTQKVTDLKEIIYFT